MSDNDHVMSYDSEGNLRHYTTTEPEFGAVNADNASTKVVNGTVVADHHDFAEVQDAVDFAGSNGYAEIVLPEGGGSGANGEYIVTVSGGGDAGVDFTLASAPNTAVLRGEGRAVIKLADAQATDHDSVVEMDDNITIRDLVIDGNKANQTDGGTFNNQRGIGGNPGVSNASIHNVEVRNAQYMGIWIRALEGFSASNIYTHDNGHRGFQLRGLGSNSPAVGATVSNLYAYNNGGASADPNTQEGVTIGDFIESGEMANIVSESNAERGVRVEGCYNTRVSFVTRDNGGDGAYLTGNRRCDLDGYAENNGGGGIEVQKSTGNVRAYGQSNTTFGVFLDNNVALYDCYLTATDNGQRGVDVRGNSLRGTMVITAAGNNTSAGGYAGVHIRDDANGGANSPTAIFGRTQNNATGVEVAAGQGAITLYGKYSDGITDPNNLTTTYT